MELQVGSIDSDDFGNNTDPSNADNQTGSALATSYVALQRPEKWFLINETDSRNMTDVELKHSAELNFYRKKYAEAEKLFLRFLKSNSLQQKQNVLRREIFDSLARCCLSQNKVQEALQWAHQLYKISRFSGNPDYYSSCLSLLYKIYDVTCDDRNLIWILCYLIKLNPGMPKFWYALGRTYGRIRQNMAMSKACLVQSLCLLREAPKKSRNSVLMTSSSDKLEVLILEKLHSFFGSDLEILRQKQALNYHLDSSINIDDTLYSSCQVDSSKMADCPKIKLFVGEFEKRVLEI